MENQNDPFEDFQFKPITEGLGFHDKKTPTKKSSAVDFAAMTMSLNKSISNPTQAAPVLKNNFIDAELTGGTDLLAKTNKSMQFKNSSIDIESDFDKSDAALLKQPLPRKTLTNIPQTKRTETNQAVDDILKSLKSNRQLEQNAKQQAKNLNKEEEKFFVATVATFPAMILDSLLVVAAFLLSMIALLMITKVDLIANLSRPDTEGMIYIATAVLFLAISFVYQTVNRLFLGCTPGEWAYEYRLGTEAQQNSITFAVKSTLRSLINVATGVIVLPLLSLVFRNDIAGVITGMKLMKRN